MIYFALRFSIFLMNLLHKKDDSLKKYCFKSLLKPQSHVKEMFLYVLRPSSCSDGWTPP